VRLDDRRGFTRHIVRLRQTNGQELLNVGDSVPEIVLVNSHDGTSAYQLHAGIFRLVCSNGLVIADSTFSKISIRHSGDVVGRVIDATSEVVREIPRIASGIRTMQAIELSPSEREAFAASALSLRESAISLEPAHLLHVRRAADSKPDLWSTFKAHAHLIAAAPELLEAVKRLLDPSLKNDVREADEALARAVVAKATGG
jgi:hypothetical protein